MCCADLSLANIKEQIIMSNIFFVQPNRDFRSDVLCGQSCRDAKRDKTALEFEVKDLKKKLESKIRDLQWAHEDLKEEKQYNMKQMEELKTQLAQVNGDKATLNANIVQLEAELKIARSKIDELTKKLDNELQTAAVAENMLMEQNLRLHEQVEALSAEKAQLIERNTSLLAEINRLRSSELGNPLERDNFKGAKNWPDFAGEDGTNPT